MKDVSDDKIQVVAISPFLTKDKQNLDSPLICIGAEGLWQQIIAGEEDKILHVRHYRMKQSEFAKLPEHEGW